jgi:hypothetical protein
MTYAAVQSATDELVALALKMRSEDPAWEEGEIRKALAACHGASWPFAQAALELVRLTVIPDSEPRDLINAARSPFSHRGRADHRPKRRG